jgi:hypothetical protein
MTLTFYAFVGFVVVLLGLLAWVFKSPARNVLPNLDAANLEDSGRSHATYLPQLQHAFGTEDVEFLVSQGAAEIALRLRKERSPVVLLYLSALRGDFQKLLRLARVIAALSPEVEAMQEFERLRLNVEFALRYESIRIAVRLGLAPLPQLRHINQMVGALSVRMEAAVTELGERAALAAELASSLERRRVDLT